MIDQQGRLQLLEPIELPPLRRIFIAVLEEEPALSARETAILSEAALGVDWLTPEEDVAWSHLAQLPSL
jgi:hypothetical protein